MSRVPYSSKMSVCHLSTLWVTP